jgi:glucose-6-phosphate isomerase
MAAIDDLKLRFFSDATSGFSLDWSRGQVSSERSKELEKLAESALAAMADLEAGGIANPDEGRMVGHYWLRTPEKSPDTEIANQIEETRDAVLRFIEDVHSGVVKGAAGKPFKHLVLAGIGGSALGPQLLDSALAEQGAPMDCYYLDNTDPAGLVDTVNAIPDLSQTLCVVISKSGGTRETRNAMLWMERVFGEADIDAAKHMVAVTQEGSKLDSHARENSWLARFPMWDWVGGRVSLWSAVGLLPAGLIGIDVKALLAGAAHMDALTRSDTADENPALVTALHWYELGGGKGERTLVMLPYRDQLEKFSKYLQQLVMESIGKKQDLDGAEVHQGLYVMGNKGSTDQHSYVQQLRDGLSNFIAHFVEVREDAAVKSAGLGELAAADIEEDATAGDYLLGFLQGTRIALSEAGRPSLLYSIPQVTAFNVGMLLALFERAVGYYATLINVNAYHQPGVEAGKKAAGRVLEVQKLVLSELADGTEKNITEIVEASGLSEELDYVFAILRHLAANKRLIASEAKDPFEVRYKRG